MGTITILPETTRNPISLIGARAGICWNADISDSERNFNRGIDCIKSDHGRVMEYVNVEMVIEGYSARVIREWYTHLGGAPTRLQESTRYINFNNFSYVNPKSLRNNTQGKEIYDDAMKYIMQAEQKLEQIGIPTEDRALLLPLGMTTKIVDKRNLRNLIDMSRQRLCLRANWEYRELFVDILISLKKYSDEWDKIVLTQMMPKCKYLGFCPEKNPCGRYTTYYRDKVTQRDT